MNIIYKSMGIAIAITVLTACAGPSKKTLLPDRGPTTMEVYAVADRVPRVYPWVNEPDDDTSVICNA